MISPIEFSDFVPESVLTMIFGLKSGFDGDFVGLMEVFFGFSSGSDLFFFFGGCLDSFLGFLGSSALRAARRA